MMKALWFGLLLGVVSAGYCPKTQAVPTTNGLYATFGTSKGTFSCILRYDLVPRTVANFVGLTEGNKEWLDYQKGTVVKRPFYNGLTFHRVISGFVIQGGSPNGNGNDDPGYRFRNEITPLLTHNKAGILAMANSGGTNSNGSQFYVTLSPQPSLDGRYTIFGEVVEGLDVVTNIGNVATDVRDKPLVPVYMTNVTVLRIGQAASNFNASAVSPPLPIPLPKLSRLEIQQPHLILFWEPLAGSEYRFCFSGDLRTWNGLYIGAYAGRYLDDFWPATQSQFFVTFESKID